ncbi:retropepsin-like aspartic protease family protein [Ancylobacter terrae]|uniref:retropepsin-like aspartic protease family protein n=1 Tax=Ancylobacter sp. sgz301288 TaxID=3342077 RepID=UPI00385D32A6
MLKPVLIFAALVLVAALAVPDLVARFGPPTTAPARPAPSAAETSGSYRIAADRSGHFLVQARIDGRDVEALVDTGATVVALTYEDARRIGAIGPADRFDDRVATANGIARARRVRLASVRVGPITVSNIDALVAEPGALGVNLLGMSFLRRLQRFEVSGGLLLLER